MPTSEIAREREVFGDRLPDALRSRLEASVLEGSFELPVLPEVAQQVAQASRDPNIELRELAELIRRDTALAANVLRIANSALYAGRVPIVSLQHALSRLGMEQIRHIALLIACDGAVFRVPGHVDTVRALFRHSLAAACIAGEIARLKRRNVEEAYLTGLFHGVGRPVVMQLLASIEKTEAQPVSAPVFDVAVREFAPAMTARVLAHWQIAEPIREAIAYIDRPDEAPNTKFQALTLALAVCWGRALVEGAASDEQLLRVHPLNGPLDLYPDEIASLFERREAILALVGDLG